MPCPQPHGLITAGAEKEYPVDLSYFNIMGTAVGAHGVEATSEAAVFSNVNLEVSIYSKNDSKPEAPVHRPWSWLNSRCHEQPGRSSRSAVRSQELESYVE